MCFYCHDKVVIKGKEVYYPFQLLALAFTSLVKPSHHPLVHLATMTQWYHFLTSYPVSPFPPVKLRTPFVQPCSNDSRPLRHLQILLTVFTLYLQTRIVLCSPRKCSLDPAALSSCCSIFFSFYCQTFQFSNKQPISAASIFFPWHILESGFYSYYFAKKEFPILIQSLLRPICVRWLSYFFPSPFLLYPEPGLFYFLSLIQSPFFLSRIFTAPWWCLSVYSINVSSV